MEENENSVNLLYNYTDVEQSKRLMAAGLDPKTADMHWTTETGRSTGGQYYKPMLGWSPAVYQNLFSFRNGYELPCWSFPALFALLPVIDRDEPQLKHLNTIGRHEAGEYRICYNNQTDHPFVAYGVTMIDAVVDIVEQMCKAGWIFESTKKDLNPET